MPEVRPFRLSLGPDVAPFGPEIEYVAAVLEDWYPLRRSGNGAAGDAPVLHYGARPPKGAFRVPARLFPKNAVAGADGIRLAPDCDPVAIDGLLPPVGAARPRGRSLSYDAIGLAFLMLSRLEERDAASEDRYGRFAHATSFAARAGRDREPLADIALDDIAAALLGTESPPRRTEYQVLLTHDVDRLRGYHRPFEPLRNAVGDIVNRGRPLGALRRISEAYFGGEPSRSVRELMTLGERHDLACRFYFMGPSRESMDSPYAITMRGCLKRTIDAIRTRGHTVGFHPGFGTARDPARWLEQKSGLESVIGAPVSEGRQHVLDYDAAVTPEIWNDAGMRLDTTLAFPELTGFRAGTCRPFPAYSLTRREKLALRQICTAVMDFGLFGGRYRALDHEAALDEARRAAAICKRYGGSLVVLYHTGQAADRPLARYFDDLLAEAA